MIEKEGLVSVSKRAKLEFDQNTKLGVINEQVMDLVETDTKIAPVALLTFQILKSLSKLGYVFPDQDFQDISHNSDSMDVRSLFRPGMCLDKFFTSKEIQRMYERDNNYESLSAPLEPDEGKWAHIFVFSKGDNRSGSVNIRMPLMLDIDNNVDSDSKMKWVVNLLFSKESYAIRVEPNYNGSVHGPLTPEEQLSVLEQMENNLRAIQETLILLQKKRNPISRLLRKVFE